jgi:hypothetical protein
MPLKLPHLIEKIDVSVVDSEIDDDHTSELIYPFVVVQREENVERGLSVGGAQSLHVTAGRVVAHLTAVRARLLLVLSPSPS